MGGLELLGIAVLAAMFLVATVLPVNMGLLGLAAAFAVGLYAGVPTADVVGGFPAGLFLTLVGITFLFAVAHANGTIEKIVAASVGAVRGHVWAIPWIMFATAAILTAFGAVSPAAVAILAPIAIGFAVQHRISPLLMGLMVVHGAQGGGFSPISIYGGIVNRIVAEAHLPISPMTTFAASLGVNFAAALILFFVLRRRTATPAEPELALEAVESVAPSGWSLEQLLTLFGLLALAVLTLFFKVDVGFAGVAIGLLLSMMSVAKHRAALARIPWPEILLVAGVGTYVAVLEQTGVIKAVGAQVATLGAPMAAALLLCVISGVVSAFASSTAVLGSLIPLGVPLLLSGAGVDAVGFIAAMAVSSTIVDVSPFSTNGALVLANAQEADRPAFFRQLMIYGAIATAIGPVVAWAVFVAAR